MDVGKGDGAAAHQAPLQHMLKVSEISNPFLTQPSKVNSSIAVCLTLVDAGVRCSLLNSGTSFPQSNTACDLYFSTSKVQFGGKNTLTFYRI